MSYTIVIPVLNDADALARLLESLRVSGANARCLVVDGGSSDTSVDVAARFGCDVVDSPAGRATQLRAGCGRVTGGWIWMLHADCRVCPEVIHAMAQLAVRNEPGWGRFDVGLDHPAKAFRVIETSMNWRSRLTGICTGDQGIFVHTDLLAAAGGIPDQPLMEDVELSRRLKRRYRPLCRAERLDVSARRWQARGVVRTVLLMWCLRLAYFVGVSPARLHRVYYGN